MDTASRSECIFLAKLSEQAERYDDMLQCVKRIVKLASGHLTSEERGLLSVVYKTQTGTLRSSWRIVTHLEETVGPKSSSGHRALIRKEREIIERELINTCEDVLTLLESETIPVATSGEEAVFYHKMKGDYYRYLTEFSHDDARTAAASASLVAYKRAYKLATTALEATNPTRLGLALNFAVYYRDVFDSPERACHLAKHAFDDAVAELEELNPSEETYKDSMIILQLLRDDLTLWYKEMQQRGEVSPVERS